MLNRTPIRLLLLILLALPSTAMAAAPYELDLLEDDAIRAAAARVEPAVVQIETFAGLEQVDGQLFGGGPTTGLVVDEDGYVISSAFHFAHRPASILVTLPDGSRAAAEIVARDHSRMLVLLKVHVDEPLAVPEAAPKAEMRVGQWAIAVGRTFSLDSVNISAGVVSALDRIWGRAIQTDAKISPNNYGGPLVDIRGRVLGVLVPLSPQGGGELAGAEWYDSGIGFAIPLVDILQQLDPMKAGRDVRPGLLGVALRGNDLYASPVEIAVVEPRSPAARAGLEAGDQIVEVDGLPIQRQAQLRHALGPRNAGETVHIVALRDQRRQEFRVPLAAELEPYEWPLLGVLPERLAVEQPGLEVRFVYPRSGADRSGIRRGDRLLEIAGQPLGDGPLGERVAAAQQAAARHEPGEAIEVELERDGEPQTVQVTLGGLPTEIPSSVPPPAAPAPAADAGQLPTGVIEVKPPEEQNEALAYVPTTYRADVPHGLLVWLPTPGRFQQDALLARWRPFCEQHALILLVPKPLNNDQWLPTEIDFVRKTINDVQDRYHVDPARIVVHGHEAGGAMAYLVAFAQRELVRGLAVTSAAMPERTPVGRTDPLNRLAVYATLPEGAERLSQIRAGLQRLRERKYPVTVRPLESPRYLNQQELEELVRWIDTLDRI